MELNEKQQLLTALKNGTVTVTFQKIGTGEIRVMPCTLNPTVLKAEGVDVTLDMNADSDNFAVWSLDKTAWRSFVLDTVKGWEVLGE
tara:strand:+ start:8263 stop:8523 length:261 start_codon:yes stop_codon:yes gene_type:complete